MQNRIYKKNITRVARPLGVAEHWVSLFEYVYIPYRNFKDRIFKEALKYDF